MPTRMRAVQAVDYGGPEVLRLTEMDVPRPRSGEVLIAVRACGVGPWDLKRRAGAFGRDPAALPLVLGTELCGHVEEVGVGVEDLAVGDRVFGYVPSGSGANAELACVQAAHLAQSPGGVPDAHLAAAPVGVLTAWQALVEGLGVTTGTTFLVTGAAGGMGSLAVQLARALGARVIATARARDLAATLELGASEAVEGAGNWPAAVRAIASEGVDAVLDCVGGSTAREAATVIRDDGALVTLVPGAEPAQERGIRTRSFVTRPDGPQLAELATRLQTGELRVALADVLNLTKARAAHERLEAGGVAGKLALSVD